MIENFLAKSDYFENITLDVIYEDEKKMYLVFAKNDKKEEMGYINFSLNPQLQRTWLWRIETYEPFQHQGIATALLSFMESESISRRYGINKEICISKKSTFKKTYFKFVTWGTVTIANGSIQSGNTNMLNDNKKYDVYVREV